MPKPLSRDEYSYKAERDHRPDDAPCKCGSCATPWRYDQLLPIGDCSLTPGDPSPAGRCPDPNCDSLAYLDRPLDRAWDVLRDQYDSGGNLKLLPGDGPNAPPTGFGHDDEHPEHTRSAWMAAIAGGCQQGYWEWVKSATPGGYSVRLGNAKVAENWGWEHTDGRSGWGYPSEADAWSAARRDSAERAEELRLARVEQQSSPEDHAAEVAAAAKAAPRHVFEVYDSRDGERAAFYPVDVSTEANCRQAAHRKAAELNADHLTDPFKVRELGRPDEIAPGEYEKAVMLGYKVNPDPAGGWELSFPDDATDPDPDVAFGTERDAWEAADNHRMFGHIAVIVIGDPPEPQSTPQA